MASDGSDRGSGLTLGFVARATLTVIAVWALLHMVWLARDLFFVAFFAVLVASFLAIFVGPVARVGVPRGIAALVVLLAVLGGLVGLVLLTWPMLQDQFVVIRQQFPRAAADVVAWVEERYIALTGQFGEPDERMRQQIRQRVSSEAAELVAGTLPMLNTLFGAVAGLLIILFAGLYLAVEPRVYMGGLTQLLPPSARPRVRHALAGVETTLRQWMLGTVISMAIIGGLTAVGLWVLGVPAALALGLIAGLFEFIPYFGPIFAAVPAVAVALTVSPMTAVWAIVVYTIIQQLEGNLVFPLVMKGTVKLPPALTILVQALMAILFGFLGLLLAVPVLVSVRVLVRRLYVEPMESRG